MHFDELSTKVLAAYGNDSQASNREALALVQNARTRFPERQSTLIFWEACLLSLTGEPEAALECLRVGLKEGTYWHRKKLADPDLDAARNLPGWQEFEDSSARRAESIVVERPRSYVRIPAAPKGTIVALHGAGHVPIDFKAEWVDKFPDGWSAVAPVGDVPLSDVSWAWPYDLDTRCLIEALEEVDLVAPVILAGFSQGAGIAARAAWNGEIPASGLLLSAATLSLDAWSSSMKTPVPLYAVVGTKDGAYSRCTAIAADLECDGVPVHLDVRVGLGHRPPADLEETIRTGIDWILDQQ